MLESIIDALLNADCLHVDDEPCIDLINYRILARMHTGYRIAGVTFYYYWEDETIDWTRDMSDVGPFD